MNQPAAPEPTAENTSAHEASAHQPPAGGSAAYTPTPPRAPTGPRTWPIVWGAIVLIICAYATMQLVSPGSLNTTIFVLVSMIALGVLLLAVGGAVLARNLRNR